MSIMDTTESGLEGQLQTIKQEVDALQISLAKKARPWYREAAVIVAALALVFSFGTTTVSLYGANQQAILDQRAELRGLIQRLTALPKENAELLRRFADDPLVSGTLSSMINQENALIARQAADLVQRLEQETVVSSLEYAGIAGALMQSGFQDGVNEFLQKAVDNAAGAAEAVTALRMQAAFMMNSGNVARGRETFASALDVFSTFDNDNGYFVLATHAVTEMFWSQAEFAQAQCDESRKHLAAARTHTALMTPGPFTDQINNQIAETGRQVLSC